jgi:hypothetical protein
VLPAFAEPCDAVLLPRDDWGGVCEYIVTARMS